VLVLMKFSTCPEVTAKYPGTLTGRYVAALLAAAAQYLDVRCPDSPRML
jgi:hypothetical protein